MAVTKAKSTSRRKVPVKDTKKQAVVVANRNIGQRWFNPKSLVIILALFPLIGAVTLIFTRAATAQGAVVSGLDAGKCLDNQRNIKENRNKIQLYDCNGTNAQKWNLLDNGTIVNANGYCLDVAGASKSVGALVQLYQCNGTVAQKWSIKSNGSLVNPNAGLCLDAKYAKVANGTQIWMYMCNGTKAQQWKIPTVPKPTEPTPTPTPTPPNPGASPKPVGVPGTWQLKFNDNFDGNALNTKYWATSWFNGGRMNDVATSSKNQKVAEGILSLSLSSSSTGALVSTDPSQVSPGFEFGYGYTEARINFPGSGSTIYNWPAWWTNGQPEWPTHGEVDIAEGLGELTSNYHYGAVANKDTNINNSGTIPGAWSNGWHTYGVLRQPGKNSVYWDGKLIRTYTTYEKGAPHFLILNVGAGQGPTKTGAAGALKIDYVRVWQ